MNTRIITRRTPFTTLQSWVDCLLDVNHLINSIISKRPLELITEGRDQDAVKHVEKVKALIDKPLDKLELLHIRLAMATVKCPRKLDNSVFYRLTRRLPHEDGVELGRDPGLCQVGPSKL